MLVFGAQLLASSHKVLLFPHIDGEDSSIALAFNGNEIVERSSEAAEVNLAVQGMDASCPITSPDVEQGPSCTLHNLGAALGGSPKASCSGDDAEAHGEWGLREPSKAFLAQGESDSALPPATPAATGGYLMGSMVASHLGRLAIPAGREERSPPAAPMWMTPCIASDAFPELSPPT